MSRRSLAPLAFALIASAAAASSDPLSDVMPLGGAAIGLMPRAERSLYTGAETRYDLVPVYIYEGERVYLRSLSLGLRLAGTRSRRLEVFLRHRFEGHPTDDIPEALAGMARREPGIDLGIGGQTGGAWGYAFAEILRDASEVSNGTEVRLGYKYPARLGPFGVKPHALLALRSASLNDYYYGV